MKQQSVFAALTLALLLSPLGCSGERTSFKAQDKDDTRAVTTDAGSSNQTEVSPTSSTGMVAADTSSQSPIESATDSTQPEQPAASAAAAEGHPDEEPDEGPDEALAPTHSTNDDNQEPGQTDTNGSNDPGSNPRPAESDTGPDSMPVPTATATEPAPTSAPSEPSDTTSPSEPVTPPSDPGCEDECCADENCPNDRGCDDGACVCVEGTKDCDGECIDEAACCSDDDCGARSHCADGGCECDDEAHQCGDACVVDDAPETCGERCEPCPTPTGGSADCDGTECSATCSAGKKLCAGACIADSAPCDAECPAGSHDCSGLCIERTSSLACGSSCAPCTAPANATATCDGTSCDFQCASSYSRCNDGCIPESGCCDDADCSADKVCNPSNTCICASGTKQCGTTCIANAACCSDSDCGAGLGCRNSACVDNAPPTVVSITPSNHTEGVASNAIIKLTFSESMNQSSVQSALSISNLSSANYTLTWSGAGTQLTISPSSALPYGAASSMGGGGERTFTVGIATTAKDLNDNRLAVAFSSSFSTLRRITQTISPAVVGRGSTYTKLQGMGPFLCAEATANVGPFSNPAQSGSYYIWVEYDLASVAETTQITTFESAKFMATQAAQAGAFYPNASVDLLRDEYADIDGWYDAAVDRSLSTLSSDATVAVVKTITNNFFRDWQDHGPKQLYQLKAVGSPASNNLAKFTCTGFSLELVFLAP